MNHIVIHYHEIGLKGKNRSFFEERLRRNIEVKLAGLPVAAVRRLGGRLLLTLQVSPIKNHSNVLKNLRTEEEVVGRLQRVFGIASFAPVAVAAADLEDITRTAITLVRSHTLVYGSKGGARFAVRAKRSDKKFPKTSEEVNRIVGRAILEGVGGTVDLGDPNVTLEIEIIPRMALLSVERFSGPGGLPVGTAGKVFALLSGGIDSPVAAWKVMKRGCEVIFAHFHSYPHTDRASIEKVRELAGMIGAYQPRSALYLIPFAEAQRQVVMHTAPRYRVMLYRRLMMRIASELARREYAEAIVTGESIGQVASQTLPNLRTIEDAADFPVLRPLVGDDKEEIITKAKLLGTFDISIRPHDDCCTLFLPRNPATRARTEDLKIEEAKLPVDELVAKALEKLEREVLGGHPERSEGSVAYASPHSREILRSPHGYVGNSE